MILQRDSCNTSPGLYHKRQTTLIAVLSMPFIFVVELFQFRCCPGFNPYCHLQPLRSLLLFVCGVGSGRVSLVKMSSISLTHGSLTTLHSVDFVDIPDIARVVSHFTVTMLGEFAGPVILLLSSPSHFAWSSSLSLSRSWTNDITVARSNGTN